MTVRGNMASVMRSLSLVFQSVARKIFWSICVGSTFSVCIYKKKEDFGIFILFYVAVYIILGKLLLFKRY